jgi:mediator of RNA polymerase II transcription subunit 17
LEMFSKPFDGKATLTLPSLSGGVQVENLTISTRTVIGQPTFGTEHKLTLPSSLLADLGLFQHLKFSSVEETTSYLDWVLSLHIAHRQLTREFSSRATIKGNDSRVTIVGSKGSKKAPPIEYDILIELQNGELKATALDVSPQELLEDAQQSHTWNGKGGETSLIAMIRSWVG